MYIVKIKGSDEIIAICSRKSDAQSLIDTKLDNQTYYIEESINNNEK